MSSNHLIPGNRNSTPETSSSNLRLPPRSSMAPGHQLRASADMGAFSSAAQSNRNNRPASEVIYNQMQQGQNRGSQDESVDKATQQWIADIDQFEATLDEMAAAALDHEFKDELTAIEQWFRVLSEAERTAALYALLQQTTQVQIRFFIGVLKQMSRGHPTSGIISPSSLTERDSMSHRLSAAMSKLGSDRNSLGPSRVPSNATKRNSGLDQDEINSMFPDAAAAIAKQKADFEQQTGAAPQSNRNSAVGDRASFAAPTISAPRDDKKDAFGPASPSPWRQRSIDAGQASSNRPKSSSGQQSSGQQPMGQFSQPPLTAGLRPPRNFPINTDNNNFLQSPAIHQPDTNYGALPMMSPFGAGGWASQMNTPAISSFPQHTNAPNASIAAATQAKLGAMTTLSNVQLDDARKFRRARSTEEDRSGMQQMPPNMGGAGLMRNQFGQVLSPEQAAALQAQQLAAMTGRRSPTGSPARGVPAIGMNGMGMSTQNNGFLSVVDPNQTLLNGGMAGMNLGQYDAGYLSDASEINRGRSPRGRRATSKPPDDPTDLELLKDIPAWLRSLRLHKYTDNLKDMKWTDLVQLDDDGLDKKGVNALGARRKMLKVFEQVREAQDQGKL